MYNSEKKIQQEKLIVLKCMKNIINRNTLDISNYILKMYKCLITPCDGFSQLYLMNQMQRAMELLRLTYLS